MEGPRGPVGVINVVGLNIAELKNLPATLTSLEGESAEERIAAPPLALDADDAGEPGAAT